MLSEAEDDWHMDLYAVEANLLIDTILHCIAKYISTRPIFLSSFSPEICIMLSLKQSRWPIFFGNDSGNWQPSEVRAKNMQEGVRFAKRWDLNGLALASEPLIMSPGLTRYTKEKGLVVASYGAWNDEPEKAKVK
jgi:glycerophosphoryl diester phosphodiesterase